MQPVAWILLYIVLVLLFLLAAYEINYINPYISATLWVVEATCITTAFLVVHYRKTSPPKKRTGKHSLRR
jgi:hypothetical protein